MAKARIDEKSVMEQLVAALRALPEAEFRPPQYEPRARREGPRSLGARIDGVLAGRPLSLLVEIRKSAYPRDVREILWQLKQFGILDHLDAKEGALRVPLLAAISISTGAKELLREERVGYFDTGGSLFIPAPGTYVYIDKPAPQSLEKSVRTLFQGKRAQVLHALLLHRETWFSVKRLADLAQVSPSMVSETLTALEQHDWVIAKGSGPTKERQLTQPGALLDEWARQNAAFTASKEHQYYVPSVEQDALIDRLSKLCNSQKADYALTREAAAQTYAPFLSTISHITCRMPPGETTQSVLRSLDARSVREGANLSVIETISDGEFLFREQINGVWLASPVQVYLDLLQGSGRSHEMAQHLRREKLSY